MSLKLYLTKYIMDIHLPTIIISILTHFSQLFSVPSWKKAQILCIGAILCQGARRKFRVFYMFWELPMRRTSQTITASLTETNGILYWGLISYLVYFCPSFPPLIFPLLFSMRLLNVEKERISRQKGVIAMLFAQLKNMS